MFANSYVAHCGSLKRLDFQLRHRDPQAQGYLSAGCDFKLMLCILYFVSVVRFFGCDTEILDYAVFKQYVPCYGAGCCQLAIVNLSFNYTDNSALSNMQNAEIAYQVVHHRVCLLCNGETKCGNAPCTFLDWLLTVPASSLSQLFTSI